MKLSRGQGEDWQKLTFCGTFLSFYLAVYEVFVIFAHETSNKMKKGFRPTSSRIGFAQGIQEL
jgi:hypothetical protein